MSTPANSASWVQRVLLPGLAFKAMVIGGGYATGRELAEFFLPSGAWGGVFSMLLAAASWSLVCITTFLFAHATRSLDYRRFFGWLLGPFWIVFEASFALCAIVVLSVYGAAAGAVAGAILGCPLIIGTFALMIVITAFVAFGNDSVERLFKYVSFLLYGVYAAFFVLSFTRFGSQISEAFSRVHTAPGWAVGGLSYAAYNLIGAVLILPATRHMRGRADAIYAGLLAGPLAMLPALLFFVAMAAFPELKDSSLPSDVLLGKLDIPAFRIFFQIMIFSALVESGTGTIHAINQRVASAVGGRLSWKARTTVSIVVLIICMLLAARFGLVALISRGYRLIALVMLGVYIIPLFTIGVFRFLRLRHVSIASGSPPSGR